MSDINEETTSSSFHRHPHSHLHRLRSMKLQLHLFCLFFFVVLSRTENTHAYYFCICSTTVVDEQRFHANAWQDRIFTASEMSCLVKAAAFTTIPSFDSFRWSLLRFRVYYFYRWRRKLLQQLWLYLEIWCSHGVRMISIDQRPITVSLFIVWCTF